MRVCCCYAKYLHVHDKFRVNNLFKCKGSYARDSILYGKKYWPPFRHSMCDEIWLPVGSIIALSAQVFVSSKGKEVFRSDVQ